MNIISSRPFSSFLAATAIALALPLAAAAHPGGEGGHGPMPGHGPAGHHGDMGFPGGPGLLPPHALHALNLADEQKDKLFEIMHAQMPQVHYQMKDLRKAQEELRALEASPEYSEAKAKTLADAIARATGNLALGRVKADRQIYELLTPEQRKQLAEFSRGFPPR